MTIAPIVAVVVVTFGLGFVVFWTFWPARPTDRPGPHNNWRKNYSGVADSSCNDGGYFVPGEAGGSGSDGGHH